MKIKKSLPSVDVIVVTYNNKQVFNECFRTILDTNYGNVRFLVVDNNTEQNYVDDFIKNTNKKIIHIKNKINRGWAGGCNSALPYINSEYCIFLNDDIKIVDNEWLKKLVKFSLKNKNCIVGPKLLNKENYPELNITYFSKFFSVANTAAVFPEKDVIEVPYLGTFLIESKLLKKIGGYRDFLFLYYEDVDICFRLRLIFEKKIILLNKINMIHYHQASVSRTFKNYQVKKFMLRNSFFIFLMFYSKKNIIKFLPTIMLRILLNVIAYRKPFLILSITKETSSNMKNIIRCRRQLKNKLNFDDPIFSNDVQFLKYKKAFRI